MSYTKQDIADRGKGFKAMMESKNKNVPIIAAPAEEPGMKRFWINFFIGFLIAYLLGPLSPIPGVQVWGIITLFLLPLVALTYVIYATIRR